MKWSKLTKKVAETLLADSLKTRVGFFTASYRNEQDRQWIAFDGEEILTMHSGMEHGISYQMYSYQHFDDLSPYEQLYLYGRVGAALHHWLIFSIDEVLSSENILLRALGLWDRRLGKRRLRTFGYLERHPLERVFYFIRCNADGLPLPDINLESDLKLLKYESNRKEFKKERQEHSDKVAERLKKSKKTFDLRALVRAVYKGKQPDEMESPYAAAVAEAFNGSPDRDHLFSAMEHVARVSKLLDDEFYILALFRLLDHPEDHLRPVIKWSPESYNIEKQFSSLARHLWAKYPIPIFMDHAWLSDDGFEAVFKGLGSGENVRRYNDLLPVSLTKKEAHHFLMSPDNFNIPCACRWAQVHAMDGDARIVYGLLETKIIREFVDDKFWKSVIKFFIDNPMLDTVHYNPIIDYIWNQKFEPQMVFVEEGVAEERPPPQPNFSMARRNVETLLRRVEEWHERLGRESPNSALIWKKSSIPDWSFVEGDKESKNMRIWRITELLSSKQLSMEGSIMHHCVASYSRSCHSRATSIWSLSCQCEGKAERLLTVEVSLQIPSIVQARGKRNRKPTEEEKGILSRWSEQNELSMQSYL